MNQSIASKSGRAAGYIEVHTYEPHAYDESADGPNLVEIHAWLLPGQDARPVSWRATGDSWPAHQRPAWW